MSEMQSFKTTRPVIEQISFRKAGFIGIQLEDGRLIYIPLVNFPGIANLSSSQRRQYSIIDDTILLFRDDDEVYHIQDFLGTYETNAYQSPGKQPASALVSA